MKTILHFLLWCLCGTALWAQAPDIEWQKCYGGFGYDEATSIQQTKDNGYIVAGGWLHDACGSGNGSYNGAALKIDNLGNLQWHTCLELPGWDNPLSIQTVPDGGYVMLSATDWSAYDLVSDPDIMKITDLGQVEWNIIYPGFGLFGSMNWSNLYGGFKASIQNTVEGGFIIAGSNQPSFQDSSSANCSIMKLNGSGVIEWQTSVGGSNDDLATSIQNTLDGNYIFAGGTSSNDGDVSGNHGLTDFWVVKLDKTGNIIWQKCLGGSNEDMANSIQVTPDGGYIVAGYTGSNDGNVSGNHGNIDAWVVRLDNAGNVLWQKCLGGNGVDKANSIQVIPNGGYIMAGYTGSIDGDVTGIHGGLDVWVVKLNDDGDIQWQKCFGGSNNDWANSIQVTSDGGYVFAGITYSNNGDVIGNNGVSDFWVVKLDPEEELNIMEATVSGFSIYPNPVTDIVTVSTHQAIQSATLYDLSGRFVLVQKITDTPTVLKIDLINLPIGVYFLKVKSENRVETVKVVKR